MPPRAASVASRAFLDAALAQIGKEAREDCREVRGRWRSDVDLPRGVKVALAPWLSATAMGSSMLAFSNLRTARMSQSSVWSVLAAANPGHVRLACNTGSVGAT